MEDTVIPNPLTNTSSWLRFALAFDDSTRLCRYLRQGCPEPALAGACIEQYLHDRSGPLPVRLKEVSDEQQLAALFSDSTTRRCEEALTWQAQANRNHLLGLDHPNYPTLLQDTDDAPPILYAQGSLDALDYPLLAIVGSRKASYASREHTRSLSHELARLGIGIVSGLALGVDAAAHEGALQARDIGASTGPTLAIAATPANRVYPQRHARLAERIMDSGGLILTEYPLGSPTRPWHFPRRNRLISGISLGVLVAEAGLPSGTLTTANHAINQGREIMAIPGQVSNLQARGCHFLIKQGAALIEDSRDVIDALGPALERAQAVLLTEQDHTRQTELPLDRPLHSAEEQALLDTLSARSATLDELMEHSSLSVPRLASLLGLLETQGFITTTAGGRYACSAGSSAGKITRPR